MAMEFDLSIALSGGRSLAGGLALTADLALKAKPKGILIGAAVPLPDIPVRRDYVRRSGQMLARTRSVGRQLEALTRSTSRGNVK